MSAGARFHVTDDDFVPSTLHHDRLAPEVARHRAHLLGSIPAGISTLMESVSSRALFVAVQPWLIPNVIF